MSDNKYVYYFGGGKADGNTTMKELLGGKGANLAEMNNIRPTSSCGIYRHDRSLYLLLRQRPYLSARVG